MVDINKPQSGVQSGVQNKQNDVEEVTMESTTSELIKTDLLQEFNTTSKKDNEESTNTKGKKKSRTKLDLFLIVALVALGISGLAGMFTYLELDSIAITNKGKELQIANENIQKIHNQMFAKSNVFRKNFKIIGEQLSTAPETIFADKLLIQEKADKFYPGSRLNYVTLPLKAEQIIDNPAQGYAYLDQLHGLLAEKSQLQISKFEVLKPGSKHAQAILASVLRDEKKHAYGFIVMQSPISIVSTMFKNIDTLGGHVTVKQGNAGSIGLFSFGKNLADNVNASQTLRDTTWKIHYSYPYDKYAFSFSSFWLFLVYAVLSLIFLLIGIILIAISVKRQLATKKKKASQQDSSISTAESLRALSSKSSNNIAAIKEHNSLVDSDQGKLSSIIKPNSIPDSIFLSYDIRGIIDYDINAEVFMLLGKAIANEMDEMERSEIVVGYDGRNSSIELSEALIQGMMKNGLKVFNIGMVPTPLVYYAAMEKTHGNGVMVTASHNPKDHNGLKILLDGEIYHQDKLKSLQEKTEDNDLTEPGSTQALEIKPEYIEKLSYLVSSKKKFKVVVDCANGVAGLLIIELLEKMNCQVIALYPEVDGNFPNHHADPSKTENLQDLIAAVTENKADIGMAFDADGDRIGIITSAGEIIWNDRLLMLLAKDVLSRNPKAKILYDVKSTSALHEWIIEHGGEPEMCPSGHSNVKERMAVSGAILAAEFSGHVFIKENWYAFDDPYYAALKIIEILSKDGRSSQKLFAELPDKINTPEILIPVQPGQGEEIMQKILAEKGEFEGAGLVLIDGLRAEYEDGWGLVRSSKTSSKLTLRFEADTPVALQRIAEKFKEVVLSVVFVKFPY